MKLKKFITALLLLIGVSTCAFADDYYESLPRFSSPYYAGTLKASLLNEALAELNRIREIIGVSHNITLNDTYTKNAQHGAVLLDVLNIMTHTPERPADMDKNFYDLAYDATTHGNLSAGWDSRGVGMDLMRAIHGCMDDSNNYNISALGHRRWLMNPRLKQVGFGLSVGSGSGWDYAVTYVIEEVEDYSETTRWPITNEFISWPSSNNNTPTEYFNDSDNSVAWSITPNPEIFGSITTPTVKVTRISDGKTWTLSYSSSDGYFNVNNEGYGWDPCIIFRPNGISSYNNGDKYHVEVSGLTRKSGGSGTITYDVTFGPFTGTSTKTVEKVEDVKVKDDPDSLLPISGTGTMNNLADALKMDVEDINFVANVDSSDITSSEVANTFAESEGFVITTNYATISTETGYNAFKIYLNVAGVIGKNASDVKIYLAKKSSVTGGSFESSASDEVIEAELFDADGNTFDTMPDMIIVAVDIDDAGDYSVHLAEKSTSVSTGTSYNNEEINSEASDDGSSGCNSGYGTLALMALTFGIPRVKSRWTNK